MDNFEQIIKKAIADQDIPGCAGVSSNRDGSVTYAKAFGQTSMKPENAKPFQLDTVMWVASFTKLMTSICCMQLVERGLVALDDPVYKHIPELESFTLITGVDSTGKPTEEKNPTPITLRHLLTHSSGLTYDYMHPSNIAWLTYHKKQPSKSAKILERFNCPLVFAPGTAWMYGPSLDYAGLLVERITGKTLEKYMQQHIWGPLGVRDATFFLSSRPDMKDRLADQTARNADGGLEHHADAMPWQDDAGNEVSDCMGGQGVFTTAEEYAKVLKAVLTNDTNEKLLKKATLEEFFKPQLSESSRAALNGFLQYDMANNSMGGTPKSLIKDWGLGGMLLTSDDAETGMREGTMLWNGFPNMLWWVDRKAGVCGLYAGQVVPPGDARVVKLQRAFQKETYGQARL